MFQSTDPTMYNYVYWENYHATKGYNQEAIIIIIIIITFNAIIKRQCTADDPTDSISGGC